MVVFGPVFAVEVLLVDESGVAAVGFGVEVFGVGPGDAVVEGVGFTVAEVDDFVGLPGGDVPGWGLFVAGDFVFCFVDVASECRFCVVEYFSLCLLRAGGWRGWLDALTVGSHFSTNIPSVRLNLSACEGEGDKDRGERNEHEEFVHDGSLSYIQIPSK